MTLHVGQFVDGDRLQLGVRQALGEIGGQQHDGTERARRHGRGHAFALHCGHRPADPVPAPRVLECGPHAALYQHPPVPHPAPDAEPSDEDQHQQRRHSQNVGRQGNGPRVVGQGDRLFHDGCRGRQEHGLRPFSDVRLRRRHVGHLGRRIRGHHGYLRVRRAKTRSGPGKHRQHRREENRPDPESVPHRRAPPPEQEGQPRGRQQHNGRLPQHRQQQPHGVEARAVEGPQPVRRVH